MTNAAGHRPPLGLPVPAQVTRESGTIHGVSVSEDAWYSVHDALPAGWYIGRPSYHDERREWVMYAYDPAERPRVGLRRREWTAVAATEEGVLGEMARCLREIAAGRVPK